MMHRTAQAKDHSSAVLAGREERRQRLEERLSALLERVRVDARTAPHAYADETEVPEGGE